jgi:hypothetical protein
MREFDYLDLQEMLPLGNPNLIYCLYYYSGRGLWRCLYDPSSLVLITAGFDSAIKVHHLCNSSFHDILEEKVVPDGLKYESEVFEISSPIVSGQYGPLDRYGLLLCYILVYKFKYK